MNLIYVADPMCSWCYGFGATVDALLAAPGEAAPLQLALVMGGLRPFSTEPVDNAKADTLLGHWRQVAEASGRPFAPPAQSTLKRPGFVYDTEPASRAVVTVRSRWPRAVWRYFQAVQRAFYAEGRDVTQPDELAALAEPLGIARAEFATAFASQAMRDATLADFTQCADWGLRGFPALIAQRGEDLHLVAQGYLGIEELRPRLAATA